MYATQLRTQSTAATKTYAPNVCKPNMGILANTLGGLPSVCAAGEWGQTPQAQSSNHCISMVATSCRAYFNVTPYVCMLPRPPSKKENNILASEPEQLGVACHRKIIIAYHTSTS